MTEQDMRLCRNIACADDATEAAAQWLWGDAENAMRAWTVNVVTVLASWTSGAVEPI
jgi:hypothetical protein